MSLIPYSSREGREIVLRHRNAIVVRDPSSQQLEIRTLTECPTCHQPLRSSSPDRQYDPPIRHESYVDPDYFRMLRNRHDYGDANDPPPSPVRRLVQPILPSDHSAVIDEVEDAEFISSTPAVQEGSRIRRDAFSPNYFNTFFIEEKELGRGGKGVVLLVRHEIDGCLLGHFACKRVPVGDDHAWLEKVLIEVELLAKLSHPNLVSYRHVWLEDVKLHRFGPSVACAFILQQYCNEGDLLHYVTGGQPREATKEELKAKMRRKSKGQMEPPRDLPPTSRRLSFEDIYSLFKDITSGLTYLHAANYIHRDLKPSNCLLHREGPNLVCLISDFGEVQPENMVRRSTGSTGTISYCAPEVLKQDSTGHYGNFTTKSDVFSLGMILYFLCFGRLPYASANAVQEEMEDIDELRAEIIEWEGFQDERRERPDLPFELYRILKKLLALDPAKRPSAAEVLSVMKSESSFDTVTRTLRSSSPPVGVHGRRIHNLDSPVPPSTSVHDPTKTVRQDPTARDGPAALLASADDGPDSHVGGLGNPGSPRHRAQAMAASRSQNGYSRLSHELTHPRLESSDLAIPPLLMPPPPTLAGEVRLRLRLGWLETRRLVGSDNGSVATLIRLSLFFAKMASLVRPCLPYMVSLKIATPLVAIAAMDLGLHTTHSAAGPRRSPAQVVSPDGAGRAWNLKTSLILAAAHLAVVWYSARRGLLCTPEQDLWTDWSSRGQL